MKKFIKRWVGAKPAIDEYLNGREKLI